MQYLKIPKERAAILIGKKGEVKRELQRRTKCRIEVNDEDVIIDGDALDEWVAVDIVKAIGRGFSPEKAITLLGGEKTFKIINLKDFCHTDKAVARKKGRIIGKDGKSKRVIEELCDSYLSIYGKTVSIIGGYDGVELASEAILKLIEGAPHSTVYRFLERNITTSRKSML